MQDSVKGHNIKHPEDKLEWDRLPPAAAAMKTMVFTIVNRNLLGGVIANLKQGLGATQSSSRGSLANDKKAVRQ